MEQVRTQRRTPFTCDPAILNDPDQGLLLARALWERGRREMSLDLYDQLAQAHSCHAVAILTEAYDRMITIVPRTRYTLYQSRFFDFSISPGDSVLDMGSGHMPFPLATHLADISLTDDSTGRAGANFRYVNDKPVYEVRVEATGFEDKQFDFVYCSHVLEHTDDPTAACRELMRIAKRGYIETPTKGKDTLMGSARVSRHRWHVELLDRTLIFTEYTERDMAGFGVNILMDMHTKPETDREKAFSALVWLRADQCNTMMAWENDFEFQVRKPSMLRQVPQALEEVLPQTRQGSVSVFTPSSGEPAKRPLRLMQVHTFYPNYLQYFYSHHSDMAHASYAEQSKALHRDGFSAVHMLAEHLPPLGYETQLVVANNLTAQQAWAFENGLTSRNRAPSLQDILHAQVEAFAPDVLYLSDPITFDSRFVRSLARRPQLVLGWRAANIPDSWDPTEFDLILSCLEVLRAKVRKMGARDTAHFHPGFPDFLFQTVQDVQPIHDVFFCGQVNACQYRRRISHLNLLAKASSQGRFGLRMNLTGHLEATTQPIQTVNAGPCFGLNMYRALRSGRIVFDVRGDIGLVGPSGRIQDLAGRQTANMRIFEATGVGAFLLTEHFDNLEEFFKPGVEIETFTDERELLDKIAYYLKHEDQRMEIAAKGLQRCIKDHSMHKRIKDFDNLIRSRIVLSGEVCMPIQKISLDVQNNKIHEAEILTKKISKLAKLGLHQSEDLIPLTDHVIKLSTNLIQRSNFKQALTLASAAKLLKFPARNLDLLRAQAFLGGKDHLSAQEALKEELRFFPDNDSARNLLAQLTSWSNEDLSCFPEEFQKLYDVVRPYTMLSSKRLYSLYNLAKKVCEQDISGSFVECGVAAGGSSALLAYVIKNYSKTPRKLYCFDTFGGMPEPTEKDTHANIPANETGWGTGTCAAHEESLLEVCTKLNVINIIRPVKGLFKDTLPQQIINIKSVSFLHMDGDWYESTRDIINNLYEIIVQDGVIQIDDYGHWDGCKKALHEFEEKNKLRFDLKMIDATGAWFKKPKNAEKNSDDSTRLLNLGCGYRFHPAWTNVDFKSTGNEVIAHDLGKGLPFESNSFNAVYHSHLLEHFPKNQAPKFLSECLRVLKPKGFIRVAVPDLESIARLYLLLMEKSLNGDEEAQKKYDWIMLEMFDQMVRNQPGGEMLKYWRQDPLPAEKFIIERIGSEAINSIKNVRTNTIHNSQLNSTLAPPLDQLQIGQFRLSGEVHQWMYDRYSLGKLLREAGFEEITTCRADESRIPNFNSYLLDIEADGSVRKPDTLFMEAQKPEMLQNESISIQNLTKIQPNVAHFCMQDYGGAGTAALRLHEGLISNNYNSTLYVQNMAKWRERSSLLTRTHHLKENSNFISPEWRAFQAKNNDALSKYPHRPQGLEMFSIPWSTTKLRDLHEIENSNIINLHWISGTLNINDNINFLKNRKIVWTLHDMNAFTGGCHYAGECLNYEDKCGKCPQLGSNLENDLSRKIWETKFSAYKKLNITIVSPSNWLAGCAKKSSLFSGLPIHVIPNGIPTDIFKPYPFSKIRESLQIPKKAFVILFGADSVTNTRKGFSYLIRALEHLKSISPNNQIALATFGQHTQTAVQHLGFQNFTFDYVKKESELALIYSMADVTVIPSIEDNLPNVALESLACGTPVVGFNAGGIPDIIEHKINGYLASSGNYIELAKGILWLINQLNAKNDLRIKSRETALRRYNLPLQTKLYKNLYDQILNFTLENT